MKYSIVIPIKDEEKNIVPLFEEIEPVMEGIGEPYEVIFVDDGSTDKSSEILKKLESSHSVVRVIFFDRNYGQSSAFDAGFKFARGEKIITLDGDGQNDPADIPKLVEAGKNSDLVCGWRIDRHDPLLKRIISSVVNPIRSRVCKDGMHDTGCSLKVYNKTCLEKIKLYHGMHRFLPALFRIEGFSVAEIPVSHRDRHAGRSKYNLFNRSLAPIIDMFAVLWMRRRKLSYQVKGHD